MTIPPGNMKVCEERAEELLEEVLGRVAAAELGTNGLRVVIACRTGASMAELALRVGITPTAMTGQRKRLERLGYLQEVPAEDGRRRVLRRTEKGVALVRELVLAGYQELTVENEEKGARADG